MTFSSLEFLFLFLPLFFAAYFMSSNIRWRNTLLFIGSLAFYTWGEPVFVVLMLLSVVLNYLVALAMDARPAPLHRRIWLIAGVVLNLFMLFGFKYTNFALGATKSLFSGTPPKLDLPLPLGISFYSFMALAYLIDLYRGQYQAERNPVRLFLAIAAFPLVTAGPIARFASIRTQLDDRTVTLDGFAAGLRRFVLGMGKKVLIANNVAFVAQQVFSHTPDQYGLSGAWLGALCWTLQIYFDFSGYSDMAIGLGAMMGFTYPENFNYPYGSRSISEFWRRWHMSLGSFFRDYVYIPLGGSRVSNARWLLNMGTVWALTGLWHGANWTFVVWGVYYGVALILERFVYPRFIKEGPSILQHVYTMLVVTVGWVFFFSPTLAGAVTVLKAMAGLSGPGMLGTLVLLRVIQPVYLLAIVVGIIGSVKWRRPATKPAAWLIDAGLVAVFALSVIMIVTKTFNPFIYAKF